MITKENPNLHGSIAISQDNGNSWASKMSLDLIRKEKAIMQEIDKTLWLANLEKE